MTIFERAVMGLKQIDFSSFPQMDLKELIPTVLCIDKVAYEIGKEQKSVPNAWPITNRILYNAIAKENPSFFERNHFIGHLFQGKDAFAKDSGTFGNKTASHGNTLIKISIGSIP